MAEVTAQLVKQLRDRTQAGMSDCKAALVEAGGDMEKAVELIIKKGIVKSAKRAGAVASEGEVRAVVSPDGRTGVVVEVNIQTDFAARNEQFQAFVAKAVEVAFATKDGADLGAQAAPGAGKSLEEHRAEVAGKIGENIQVRRWRRVDREGSGLLQAYVHPSQPGGKIAVLVDIGAPSDAVAGHPAVAGFAEQVALQIASMNPTHLDRSAVPAADLEKQKEIFRAQLKEEGKPEAAWPKILEGKQTKWYSEICLLEQESVMTPGSTIDALRKQVGAQAGGELTLRRFVRFERGEGIEKAPAEDFAAEVAAKIAGG
jgi:elongation factor Ts